PRGTWMRRRLPERRQRAGEYRQEREKGPDRVRRTHGGVRNTTVTGLLLVRTRCGQKVIYRNETRRAQEGRVWRHRGSNEAGAAASALFKDRTLVEHSVILVTVNYRLGMVGAHRGLTRESSPRAVRCAWGVTEAALE